MKTMLLETKLYQRPSGDSERYLITPEGGVKSNQFQYLGKKRQVHKITIHPDIHL